MEHHSTSPHLTGQESSPSDFAIPETLVREELERVLSSHDFQASRLCQNFLRYVVENTLSGQIANLKERTIGIEVFGKPTSYDPSDDAGVRVKAGEVRKRLRSYYLAQPADTKVTIEMPSGTYIPTFHLPSHEERSGAFKRQIHRWRYWLAACALVAALAALAIFWRQPHPAESPLNQFWAPVFQSHSPVFVCAAPVPVYSDMKSANTDRPSRVEDFTLVSDQFAAIGDVNASVEVAEMFARMNQPYKLRIGKDTSFRDLRAGPAVLVGFTYTQWHEIGDRFRYTIDLSSRPFGISQDGVLSRWTIKTDPDDPNLHEDYAIVSRFLYPGTNNMIVEIAGISHYGTEAAANLMTNPTLFQGVLRKLPAGSEHKNVQIVLHTDVISGFPSVPTVVATYVW